MLIRSLLLLLTACATACAQQESPSKAQPAAAPDSYAIDPSAEWYQHIRDNAPFPWMVKGRRELGGDHPARMEEFAYESVLVHAARFRHDDLLAHARRDVPFDNLVGNGRGTFKLQLIAFEGRLKRLLRVEVPNELKLQNVEQVYEAWVFPNGQTNPLCVLVSELPPGLEPMRDLQNEEWNIPVVVAGYFFKLAIYEQQALDPMNPGQHRLSAAPVLIGRSITLLPDDSPVGAWRTTFMPVVIAVFTLVALILVFLGWRYRRDDRQIEEQNRRMREQNPFEES